MNKILAWKCPHCGSLWHSDDKRHETACLERVKEEEREAHAYNVTCENARHLAIKVAKENDSLHMLIRGGADRGEIIMFASELYWARVGVDPHNQEWCAETYVAMIDAIDFEPLETTLYEIKFTTVPSVFVYAFEVEPLTSRMGIIADGVTTVFNQHVVTIENVQ